MLFSHCTFGDSCRCRPRPGLIVATTTSAACGHCGTVIAFEVLQHAFIDCIDGAVHVTHDDLGLVHRCGEELFTDAALEELLDLTESAPQHADA